VLQIQKALDQMNLRIHRVLNDITGVSGLRILDAVLAGERAPLNRTSLDDGGVVSVPSRHWHGSIHSVTSFCH
jgi:hypothetical protein